MLIEKVNTVGTDWEELVNATGLVCSQTVTAKIDVPFFDRSRVDGYAINAEDLSRNVPLVLRKTHIVPAGSTQRYRIEPGTTIKLMTGAPIPLGTGAVVMQEEVKEEQEKIILNGIPGYNANIEGAGSYFKKGQVLATEGQTYTPQLIEHIATTGLSKVPVYKKPLVYIINSGSELELPGNVLEYGRTYNSNQSMFLSLLKLTGCQGIAGSGQLADKLDLICAEIKKGLSLSDLVIITGGNSEGDFDLIPLALQEIGAQLLVKGVAMRPGHRTVVASYDNKLIFNVPGNPHAGYIIFQVLIKPVLKKMQGHQDPWNKWFNIRLVNGIKVIKSTRTFCKGALIVANNELGAIALNKNEVNHSLAPLVLDIAPNQGYKEDTVKAMLVV